MKLPRPGALYDPHDQAQTRAMIEQGDARTYKRGRDVEIAPPARLILTDEAGARYRITVAGGVVTAVAL